MTGALFERVQGKLAAGHASAPQDLWLDPRIAETASFTPAAVLVGITEREEPGFILLHRPSNMRAHPGQVAFPGGKRDPGEDAVQTALREAHEELGIPPEAVRVVGTSDTYRTGSGFEITPVIGILPPDLTIRPNPAEVAQWFEAPASFVLDPANQAVKTVAFNGKDHEFIEIMWQEHRIWGVTGAICHNLARRLDWHG
jgi:8-oxo-dGTP pyrophosphatase MutT (NUDIX family)